jgi:hypothetical protein
MKMTKLNKNRLALLASLDLNVSDFNRVNFIWTKYETGIQAYLRRHGPHHTLDHYKEVYKFLRNLTLAIHTPPISFCRVDRNGMPKPLWPLRSLIKGDRQSKRVALIIARSYEIIKLPIDYSTKTIEEGLSNETGLQETSLKFKEFLTQFSVKYPWYIGSLQVRSVNEPRIFTTLSKGPNGPAVACAHLDAKAVMNDKPLAKSIYELNLALGQGWITEWMVNQFQSFTDEKTYLTGRLGFAAEPGGKTRIFAIGDYWSQTSLKVVQDSLYNTLKSISTDSTANQDKGFKTLLQESLGKETYCFDLSAASDRIPAVMQKYRLELLGGKALGEAWHQVMTNRTFFIKAEKRYVKWKVGQPLGLLSSFPSFALWHHDIIQYSYNLDRIERGKPLKFFKDYRLLGDDVVIFNKKVADVYQQLLTEKLGIPINLSKSIIGDKENSQIEFTKRLALKGVEMSSIKHNILSKNNISSMLDLVDLLYERDFIPSDTGHYCLYPFLSSREQEQFNFMLWVRSGSARPFKRANADVGIDRDAFTVRLNEKRSQALQDKTTQLMMDLETAMPVNILYKKSSLPYSDTALGLGDYQTDNLELHPLVWALNQTGLDMSICLSTIWDEPSPDVAPVEYLPVVNSKSYFHNRKTMTAYLSKLILSVFDELSNELHSKEE